MLSPWRELSNLYRETQLLLSRTRTQPLCTRPVTTVLSFSPTVTGMWPSTMGSPINTSWRKHGEGTAGAHKSPSGTTSRDTPTGTTEVQDQGVTSPTEKSRDGTSPTKKSRDGTTGRNMMTRRPLRMAPITKTPRIPSLPRKTKAKGSMSDLSQMWRKGAL